MAIDDSKIDSLHDQMPELFDSRDNPNWKAVIEAIGQNDQDTAELVEEIRKQFSVKTATRPYLDRLGARHKVQRPRFVGMDDETFRKFIPIMSYQPKQVTLILDKLLDLFFFKEATTSFVQSIEFENFTIIDGDTLEYTIDGFKEEQITFTDAEFVTIANATANEIVSSINRQAQNSFAIAFEDSILKQTFIRIFTNTIGSKGSIAITGGLANIRLKLNGFITTAGNGVNTEWTITKIGDTMTFANTAGDDPALDQVEVGDIAIIDLAGNIGSFPVTDLDVSAKQFSFKNVLGAVGILTQTSSDDLKFIDDFIARVHNQDRRALSWETQPGEIVVEIPPTPPVVRRNRQGAAHLNGLITIMTDRISDSSIEIEDADEFPSTGVFVIERISEIQSELSPSETSIHTFNGRLQNEQKFNYTTKIGNILSGITPDIPILADLNKNTLLTADRVSNEITATLVAASTVYAVGEHAIIDGVTGPADINGGWRILEIVSPTILRLDSSGPDGTSTGGTIRVEKIGLANAGSKVLLLTAVTRDNTEGPYLWDVNADFVLSSDTTNLTTQINAGDTQPNIQVSTNTLPNEEGRIVFDFGTEKQEGPVRYFFKPSEQTIAIDPAYVFQFTHDVGSAITRINKRGSIIFDGLGSERAPYITDPSAAREVLEELMKEVKSVGVFLNFLVRFPTQLYGTLDVYRSGDERFEQP